MSHFTRDIRFRFWNGKEMIYQGSEVWLIGASPVSGNTAVSSPSLVKQKSIPTETLMQFTNNEDRNKKEIYEGDFIRLANGKVGLVKYEPDYAQYIVQWEWSKHQHHEALNCDSAFLGEVVGNIYENPELIP